VENVMLCIMRYIILCFISIRCLCRIPCARSVYFFNSLSRPFSLFCMPLYSFAMLILSVIVPPSPAQHGRLYRLHSLPCTPLRVYMASYLFPLPCHVPRYHPHGTLFLFPSLPCNSSLVYVANTALRSRCHVLLSSLHGIPTLFFALPCDPPPFYMAIRIFTWLCHVFALGFTWHSSSILNHVM